MATRKQFIDRAKELNCTLDEQIYGTLTVDSPCGKVFQSTKDHSLIITYATRGYRWQPMSEIYDELIDDMLKGLEDCDEPDCEICEEKKDHPELYQPI